MLHAAMQHAIANNATTYLYQEDNNQYYSDKRFPCPCGIIEFHNHKGSRYLEIYNKRYRGIRIVL